MTKNRHRLPWLLCLCLPILISTDRTCGQETPAAKLPDREHFHLFLLIGQSNMAGRGPVEGPDRTPHPRVLMFTKDGTWAPAVDPLHFDKPKIAGVGLGKTFGSDVAERQPEITVGLVPCAVGGSPIDAWKPRAFYEPTEGHPWDDAVARAHAALKSGTLKGVLWHQGESDSNSKLAGEYEAKLHDLIARLRAEFHVPEVPFIAGQMGRFAERPWDDAKKQVDAAHRSLPEKVPHTAVVSSEGLEHRGDQIHFDSASYREFGHRYAKAYFELSGEGVEDGSTSSLPFDVELTVAHSGFDGKMCWVHPRAGTIPVHSVGNGSQSPLVVMTMQQLLLSGSDVFYELNLMRTVDLGKFWQGPFPQGAFVRQRRPDGIEVTVCDFTPAWHAATGKLLGTGQTVWYQNNRVMDVRPRATAYAVYDPQQQSFSSWKTLQMPGEPKFRNAGAGSVQRVDLANGDILLPIYFKVPEEKQYTVSVVRCRFDGETLTYVEHGSELTVPIKRGLYEPSLTRSGERYYLTMRNDDAGYVSISNDGLHFAEPKKWTFDDGADLGNYNTQQHWVTHGHGLYLVYTRKGANNDHIFRHRAPLFIARVNPETLQVFRRSERVLIPERGARLGNFAVVNVTDDETWITVAEWMQPAGVEKYGSDNSVYVAKLKWRE